MSPQSATNAMQALTKQPTSEVIMADAILRQSGIYKITNTVNGKMYVGSAVKLKERWTLHRGMLRRKCHHSVTLQRAWDKYGPDMFVFEVLEVVADIKRLIEREQVWIDKLDVVGKSGYNICPRAGSSLGVKQSEATKAKLSASLRARDPEVHARAAAARIGLRHSAETRAKMSASKIGKVFSAEHRANLSSRVVSAETQAKITAASRGRKQSAEAIAKQVATKRANGGYEASDELRQMRSKAMKGKKKSPEHIAKIVAALTGRKQSPETTAKIQAARRANGNHIPSVETRRKLSEANRMRAAKRREEELRAV
jgi:group I intron endonuclease